MKDDLSVKLLNSWIDEGNAPDELSRFLGSFLSDDGEDTVCFKWYDSGREEVYRHDEKVYNLVWDRFNAYWNPNYRSLM